jgi:hypothetical protein
MLTLDRQLSIDDKNDTNDINYGTNIFSYS